MPTIRETIEKQRNEALESLRKAEAGEALLQEFKDLTCYTDRWDTKRFASVSVNSLVTECEITHSCGCCTDAELRCYPYTIRHGISVYADPACFSCGEANHGNGDIAYAGWARKMRDNQISEVIIAKVEQWFQDHKPQECDVS